MSLRLFWAFPKISSIYFVSPKITPTSSHVCRSLCPKELNTSSIYSAYIQKEYWNQLMSLCLSLSLLKSSKFTLSLQNLHLRPRMSAVLSAQNTSVQARSTLPIYKNATSCIHVWRFRPGGRINSNSNISDRTYVKFVKPHTMCACLKIRGKRQMWERAFCACRRFLVLST